MPNTRRNDSSVQTSIPKQWAYQCLQDNQKACKPEEAPGQSILPVAGCPQVLQESKHDVRRTAASAKPWLPSRDLGRVVAQQLPQSPLRLPATKHLHV